jgi:hypothetical protein
LALEERVLLLLVVVMVHLLYFLQSLLLAEAEVEAL